MKVSISRIRNIASTVLRHVGVPSDHTEIIVDSIIDAHRRGKGTHGISRLPIYIRKIQSNQMDAETKVSVVREGPVVSVLDANHGFGQVAAINAMRASVEKASIYGIGVVSVRHSNNFGTVAYIAEEAAKHGKIGLVLTNSAPAIAPTGGKNPVFGTNPLGIAIPSESLGFPISLDMATATAARGKVRLAAKNGDSIPLNWALDSEGNPTDDPIKALKGSMLALGGHKGYGLSLAIDVLAGLLSGAAFGGDVLPLNCKDGVSNNGHLIMAIDISHFMSPEQFDDGLRLLVDNVKAAGDSGAVFLPGEQSNLRKEDNQASVDVSEAVLKEIAVLMDSLGLSEDES
jgi:L-2-hydroxycarboxylate dehydrogenase (NAD+)